jgi:putative SOS response-associated peptidase YedK
MCGRFSIAVRIGLVAKRFYTKESPDIVLPRYNIAPSEEVPILYASEKDSMNTISLMRWGLVLPWAEKQGKTAGLINSRAESLIEKPMYRDLLTAGRCIVPATGFYEWRTDGRKRVPWYISMTDKSLFGIAGLWARGKGPDGSEIKSFTLITTEPNSLVAPLHNRMPAILARSGEQKWLNSAEDIRQLLSEVLSPYPAADMEAYEVSMSVNNPLNKGEAAVKRIQQETL